MTAITLQNVRKEFGDVVAVNDVDLEIEDGEFVTIVGPSGCGKTTTLRSIAGLEQVDHGTIQFGDRDVTGLPPGDRNVGMVFQNLALYPHMTVQENMAFGLDVAGVPASEQDERIHETAAMLDIEELLDRHPTQLSGGQQQRVAIGRTLVLDPDVFLLDEPLASLDAKLRVEIREELQELQDRVGITTIYVTHDQEQAMTMSDRIAVMNDGRLQQFASPAEVYRNPVNRFVANFIGTPSMNFFDCTVERVNDRLFAELGFTRVPLDGEDLSVSSEDRNGVLGIRPEHIEVGSDADTPATFTSRVRLVEPTGSQKIVHFEDGDVDITAIVSESQTVERGERYRLHFNPDRINFFPEDDGSRTATEPPAAN